MIIKELYRGIISENPVLRLAMGLCPALAISTSAVNAVSMGLAVMFVLTCSNMIISLVSKWIPEKVRTLCIIVVIASGVTIVDLWMKTRHAELSDRLGIYLPLIAANCIILTRARTFASKNNVLKSAVDGISMGLGFTVSLFLIAVVREFFGNNTLFGLTVIPGFHPISLFMYAPGGFFALAAILWVVNLLRSKKETDTP
jgi:Na+-translocating ferredoxin:NAD+ oxidoreductase subunit E